jgi:CHAT domain-containing protein/Flp pilus assembly protein TadD
MLKRFSKLFILFLVSLLLSFIVGSQRLLAQPSQLQQAQQYYEQGQYQNAIAILESYLKTSQGDRLEVYSSLGEAYAAVGKVGEAIEIWEQGILAYRHLDNLSPELAELLIKQSQAYINLGQNQKAISLLEEATKISKPFPRLYSLALGTQGNAYLQQGKFERAIESYRASLDLSQPLGNSPLILTALNNLTTASLKLSQKYERDAEFALQEKDLKESDRFKSLASQSHLEASKYAIWAVEASQKVNNLSKVKAYINAISLVRSPDSSVYRQQASNLLQKQPDSRTKVFLLINLASLDKKRQIRLLENAVQSALRIKDDRALSFALGALGEAYQRVQDSDRALRYTEQAIESAKQVFAYDSLYRWWWLSGRIYSNQGKKTKAIAAYRNAIASLQKIRSDLASASQEYQFNFRFEVEPVYREFMELLLSQEKPENWQEALDTFDLLQLAELETFFGDVCTPVKQNLEPSQLLAQTQSLAISTIILPQKTYLIVLRPDGQIHRYGIAINAEQFTQQIQSWRDELENGYNRQFLSQSQSLYDLLIRPLELDLVEVKPKTLVFIGDRNLRNVPMAALYDGEHYLVEKYGIAVSLGLKLISKQNTGEALKALTFGSTKAISPFNRDLPNVALETEEIQAIMGGDRFLDRDFTWENFRKHFLANSDGASIVHLATHGRFSGSTERSFIQTFDRLISLADLESLFNQNEKPIELLTLSLCQTAAGNERSVFGLAGMAIRSGIPSIVGSLWFANDETSADLMTEFYSNLKQGLSKAEALQKVQIEQISQIGHPTDWANYILVGNWL